MNNPLTRLLRWTTFPLILVIQAVPAMGQAPAAEAREGERLHALFQEEWDWTLRDNPVMATFVGSPLYAEEMPDLSQQANERRRQHVRELLERLKTFDVEALSAEDRLNYSLFRRQVEMAVEGERFPGELMPLDQMGGVPTMLPQLAVMSPRFTTAQVEALLARLDKTPVLFQQVQALLEEGASRGITPPKVTLPGVGDQLAMLASGDAEEHPIFRNGFMQLPPSIAPEDAERLREVAKATLDQRVIPAYRELHRFWVDTYYSQTRETIALADLPDGEDWYAYNVKQQTTTDLTPEEIHQIGLEEVARIRAQMEEVKREAAFDGTLDEFFEFLRTDPQFFHSVEEELLIGYRDIAKRVDAKLLLLFGKLPRLPYGVEPVPAYSEKTSTTAYYNPGSVENGLAGTFFANTYDLRSRPKWEMEALTVHEAVPGHHLQIALASELEGLPMFRRYSAMGGSTAFVEGWGLYSESLGPALGLYTDPYSKFGQLTYEMWRAIRLVVDTGMHAKGWSRRQAIDFFKANAGKAEHDIEVEVDRYIVMPGQALAYKIGELEIKRLRAYAEAELGEAFDVRAFHDHLLSAGALPLDVLAERMERWVAEQLTSAGGV